jgi:hypothetical protein
VSRPDLVAGADKLCKGVALGEGRVEACIKQNAAKLAPRCAKELARIVAQRCRRAGAGQTSGHNRKRLSWTALFRASDEQRGSNARHDKRSVALFTYDQMEF